MEQPVKLVWIGRGSTAGEGGVSVHHGGGGKGVATQLDSLAKCVAPELMFTRVETEGGRAHGQL